MFLRPLLASLALGLALTVNIPADAAAPAAPAAATSSPWTAEDILLTEGVDEVRISRDGRMALWARSAMDADKGTRASNLYLSRLDGEILGPQVQLTRGAYRHVQPQFSPNGKLISFISNRPRPESKGASGELADAQLWLISTEGGEPWVATALERGVVDYTWQDDGHIVFAASEKATLAERGRDQGKDTSQVVEDSDTPPVRLFRYDLATKKVERLSDNTDWIDVVAVSPDGRWAFTRHQQSLSFEFDHKTPPATFLTNLTTGERRRILDGRLFPGLITWERDSSGFYFSHDVSSHPLYFTAAISKVQRFDIATGRASDVPLDWERGLSMSVRMVAVDGGFFAMLANGVHPQPALYQRKGDRWTRTLLTGAHAGMIYDWAVARDGKTLLYEHSRANLPPQWYRARVELGKLVDPVQLTRLNAGFEKKALPKTEIVRFKGARGDEVEGILRYPLDWNEGKGAKNEPRPLVVAIHGGPAAADYDTWSERSGYPMILLSQKGAFVLQVNYHGSSDYGLEWVESIGNGNYYDLELPDIEAGVDAVIARGLADPKRLGLLGWSNGGVLSVELITRTQRYRAASIGAADVEWISDWGNVDFGASFDNYYLGGSPFEKPQVYIDKSPFFRLDKVTTPAIVYTGTEDRNVPPSQSWSLYRGLQQIGKAPVKLVLFPGEPHGPRKLAHQRRKVEEDMAWYDRYLFEIAPEDDPALKKGSPLELALARKTAAQVDGRWGVKVGDALAPETVAVEGVELGRFEVTRAQYAAFDPKYPVATGSENLPAQGLTFEQARQYATWLSKTSGASYRLPKESEARALYASATEAGGANNLERWAGYAPTPAEAEALRKQVGKLDGEAPLLLEVGRSDRYGKPEPVYDLAGNVAEWVIGDDGKGKLMGGSADQPADAKADSASPPYRGLRVVRERKATPAQ